MTIGSVYEVVVLQAERWCCGSNYMLTLANFIGGKSQCVPTCGDGVTVADEECDCGDGTGPVPAGCPGSNSDTTYGGCTTQCKWGAFCGDGTLQGPPDGPEECDLGKENGEGGSQLQHRVQGASLLRGRQGGHRSRRGMRLSRQQRRQAR